MIWGVPHQLKKILYVCPSYSEVPNRRAYKNKRAGLEKNSMLPSFLLSKLINKQGGIFRLLREKLRAGWKENLKNLSKHALLLGTWDFRVGPKDPPLPSPKFGSCV